jgi:hypothetical protein
MRFLALALMLVSTQAFADINLAIGGGLNFSKPDVDGSPGSGVDEAWNADFTMGAKALFDMNETFKFRTGAFLQQKTAGYDIDISGVEGDLNAKIIYASIPLTVQVEANSNFAFFGGYVLDYAINDYCTAGGDFDSCDVSGVKQITHIATAGVVLHASEKFDLEASYQHGLSEVYSDVKLNSLQFAGFFKF